MRRAEIRIERLERETAARVPERVTAAWLARQPLWRYKQIIETLPYNELVRLEEELKAEIEGPDVSASTPA